MKHTFFLLLLLTGSTVLFAQENDDHRNRDHNQANYQRDAPPPPVQQSFQREHPNADNAHWDRSNRQQWHATYKDRDYEDRNVDTYYDGRGRRVDTHIPWDQRNIPQDFDQRIYSRYHTHDYNVYRIERPNNVPLFQLMLNLGGRSRTIYTDEHGNEVRYQDRH